jgi:hypothetical protein
VKTHVYTICWRNNAIFIQPPPKVQHLAALPGLTPLGVVAWSGHQALLGWAHHSDSAPRGILQIYGDLWRFEQQTKVDLWGCKQ